MRFKDLKEYCAAWEYNGTSNLVPLNNRLVLFCGMRNDEDQIIKSIVKSEEELTVTFSNGAAVKCNADGNYFEAYLLGEISQVKPRE